jgi:hypothetical protein
VVPCWPGGPRLRVGPGRRWAWPSAGASGLCTLNSYRPCGGNPAGLPVTKLHLDPRAPSSELEESSRTAHPRLVDELTPRAGDCPLGGRGLALESDATPAGVGPPSCLGRVGGVTVASDQTDLGATRSHPGDPPPLQMETGVDGGRVVLRLPWRRRAARLPPPGRRLRHRHADRRPGRAAPLPRWAEGDACVGRAARPPQPRDARLAKGASGPGWWWSRCPPTPPSSTRSSRCGPASRGWSWPTSPATPSTMPSRRPSVASTASATPTIWPSRFCGTAACPCGERWGHRNGANLRLGLEPCPVRQRML